MYALYIGLAATVVSYMYLWVVPEYARRVQQGALADERLWWLALRHSWQPATRRLCGYALAFGGLLSAAVLAKPWLPQAGLALNISLMTCWLGGLWLLAAIDRQCYLLPDVLTQALLWLGLVSTAFDFQTIIIAMVGVYGIGRVLSALSYFGMGDVKLLVAIIPWLGVASLLPIALMACVVCVLGEAVRQRSWWPRGACAFGPYLIFAIGLYWLR